MPVWGVSRRIACGLAGALLVAGCAAGTDEPSAATSATAPATAPSSAPPSGELVEVDVSVPVGSDGAPFDRPRRALVPAGWTLEVWARTAKPRLAAWTGDGALLVTVPSAGQVLSVRDGRPTA